MRENDRALYEFHVSRPSCTWNAIRGMALARAHGQCFLCGRTARLEGAHLTYANLGWEGIGDVVPLCHSCHRAADWDDARIADIARHLVSVQRFSDAEVAAYWATVGEAFRRDYIDVAQGRVPLTDGGKEFLSRPLFGDRHWWHWLDRQREARETQLAERLKDLPDMADGVAFTKLDDGPWVPYQLDPRFFPGPA